MQPCWTEADCPLACAAPLLPAVVTDKTRDSVTRLGGHGGRRLGGGGGGALGGGRGRQSAAMLCSSSLMRTKSSGMLVCVEADEPRCRLIG